MNNLNALKRATVSTESAAAILGIALAANTEAGQVIIITKDHDVAAKIFDMIVQGDDPLNREALKEVAVIRQMDVTEI